MISSTYIPEAVRSEIPNTKFARLSHRSRCCFPTIGLDSPQTQSDDDAYAADLIHWNWNNNIVHSST